MVDAWARRNCRQVVSVSRTGAGATPPRRRTRRIVDAPTRWPSLSNSPWMRWYPQRGFSRAMRSINEATVSSRGGRPRRCGYVHFLAIRRRRLRDLPSPGEASGWFCVARRLRGATPAVRCPWTPTSGRTTTAGSAAAERSDRAHASTRVTIMPRRLTTPTPLVRGLSRLLEPLTVQVLHERVPSNDHPRRAESCETTH